jgi:hypothetical protein
MRMNSSPSLVPFHFRRALVLLVAAGFVGIVLPILSSSSTDAANAAPARTLAPARAPALAGRTKVVASSTTGMRVTLPRDATIDSRSGSNPDVSVSGAGRMVGVILTEDNVSEYGRGSLAAIRYGFCDQPGCRAEQTSMQYLYIRGGGHDDAKLEAGSYLLYVVADGAPVTVSLRLHGLSGSTVLRPKGKVHSELVVPDADNATGSPGDRAFWFGEEFDIKGQSAYLFGILRMELANWINVHWGDCAYSSTPPPRPLAYSPACPGGFNVFQNEGAVLGQMDFVRPIMSEIGGGGHFGYGIYYDAAAEVSNAYAAFLHLSLDPASL